MSARRNTFLAFLTLLVFVAAGVAAAQELPEPVSTETSIDFDGFLVLSEEVAAVRAERLVSLKAFNRMADEPDTLILDTRSAAAFAEGHIDGAVHLNFSDFTSETLTATIPSKTTRILIYCNNNFSDDVQPVLEKRAELALNVPTFVNLYGYGYTNIYELGELVTLDTQGVNWVSAGTS